MLLDYKIQNQNINIIITKQTPIQYYLAILNSDSKKAINYTDEYFSFWVYVSKKAIGFTKIYLFCILIFVCVTFYKKYQKSLRTIFFINI